MSADEQSVYDFARLEAAVTSLAAVCRDQRDANTQLRSELEEQRQRIRTLEAELLAANQKRQDVAKRVDELIRQLDHLDGEFGSAEL